MVVEAPEYGAFVLRVMRAFVRRAADDPETLRVLADVVADLDSAVTDAIIACHENAGYSYNEIASRLGTSRQAVRQRAERRKREVVAEPSIETP